MSKSTRWPLGLLALAALSACNNTTAPTAQAPEPVAAGAPSEVASPQPAASPQTDAAYVLTMDNVTAYFAAQAGLARAAASDPALEDLSMNLSREDSAQYAARLKANAKVRGIIEQSGMSTREFALTGETLMAALMTQGALDAGQLKAIPEGIDPASVQFVKQNKARIEALMKQLQGAG
ncbi:hypothetical protein [Agrilutibacter solisilvae]|uniref:DUF4142 domain-containing protein n=1 Tax=Agrilutibacter solisilvae TaxID=2763317 RepID=A0A974XYA7_9GAMM|nr:hypothetical protein [Lysobacter solisilvae]QSX77863.1 hypothetical protein I8J32_014205 [Lysobacter solisilvae]